MQPTILLRRCVRRKKGLWTFIYFFFFSFVIKGRVTGSNLLFTFKKYFFYLNQNLKRPLGKSKIIWRLDVFIRRPCALGHSLKTNTIISKQNSLIYRTIVLIGSTIYNEAISIDSMNNAIQRALNINTFPVSSLFLFDCG